MSARLSIFSTDPDAALRESEILRRRLVSLLEQIQAELPKELQHYSWESLSSAVQRMTWDWTRHEREAQARRTIGTRGSRFL